MFISGKYLGNRPAHGAKNDASSDHGRRTSPEELPLLTDSELIGRCGTSKDPFVRATYALLRCRDLFREAIVLRPEKFSHAAPSGKPVTTFGMKKAVMQRLAPNPKLQPKNQDELAFAENAIAALAGLPKSSVLIAPIDGQERFSGQDILIYQGAHKKLASLKKRYPAHFKNIEEVPILCHLPRLHHRKILRKISCSPKIAKKIFEYLTEL